MGVPSMRRDKNLHQLGLEVVIKWLDLICLKLGRNCEHYSDPNAQSALRTIQEHLRNLPVTLLEQLVETEIELKTGSSYNQEFPHQRLKWMILMNSNLTRLGAKAGLLHPDTWNPSDLYYPVHLSKDSKFWCDTLKRMSNLRELRLLVDVNDEVLHAISSGCSEKLQILEVFNFIEVTDRGMRYLERCRNLRKLQISCWCYHKDSSLARLSDLILRCPHLQEFIGYPHMGELLSYITMRRKSECPLKLIHYSESDIRNVNIETIETLCPNLRHMAIRNPLGCDPLLWDPTFDDLANSKLALESVEISGLFYYDKFERFLQQKGSNIRKLKLTVLSGFNYQHIRLIGENCPHLLHIDLDEIAIEWEPDPSECSSHLFSELKSVSLCGYWDCKLEVVANFLLSDARNIEGILVKSIPHLKGRIEYKLDDLIVKLLESDNLHDLTKISVALSLKTSRRLIHELPNLTEILNLYSLSSSDLERLKKEVSNLNIKISP